VAEDDKMFIMPPAALWSEASRMWAVSFVSLSVHLECCR